jgi:hypothetical protein
MRSRPTCVLCGERFLIRHLEGMLRCNDPRGSLDAFVGFVCYSCLSLNWVTLRQVLRRRAAQLRRDASQLDEIAKHLTEDLSGADRQTYNAWAEANEPSDRGESP